MWSNFCLIGEYTAMEAQVSAALKASNYKQVSALLKQWQAKEPQNPLLRLYAAQLQERTHRPEAAEKNYLKLLKQSPSNKIMSQARAGIQRIHERGKAQKAEALTKARAIEGGDEVAILAIATPPNPTAAARQQAINGIASVFNLDAYTARMKLPPSGFRIHRVGSWGEISYYTKALKAASVPTRSVKVTDIKGMQVFQICYLESRSPQPTAQPTSQRTAQLTMVCKSADGQLGKISFDLAEVAQQVSGQLPIFEQVVDIGNWGKTIHKEKVQDYAQVVDLHLPKRKIILRMCDRLYQYQKGVPLTSGNKELNSRIQWNHLLSQITQNLSAPRHDDFTRFGKGALEFINILPPIHPHLDIDRRAPSHWDQAFHVYSSLCYFSEV